jgi:hypothetical protein
VSTTPETTRPTLEATSACWDRMDRFAYTVGDRYRNAKLRRNTLRRVEIYNAAPEDRMAIAARHQAEDDAEIVRNNPDGELLLVAVKASREGRSVADALADHRAAAVLAERLVA